MAGEVEKDALTGTDTTGHEWDGIKELNTPLPKWWLYVLYATVIWSVVFWVLYPSWPGVRGYVGGVLGYDQRRDVAASLAEAQAGQAQWLERIEAASLDQIPADPELLSFSLAGARATFADNCVPCHGPGGAGQRGYPSLADDQWIWGGTLDDIHETLLYGIRSEHDFTRFSEMPAFGALQILSRDEIREVAHYVLAWTRDDVDPEAVARGEAIYRDQCAACHLDDGSGEPLLGAPPLNNPIWVFGGEPADIVAQISRPRHGVMPGWEERLDPTMIKMLTVYVHALGGGE
jgi:cytochrome c oxidase cbb3-type subunit III